MNKDAPHIIAQAAAKNIKTEQDLNEFRKILSKITVEAVLNAELDDNLGYSRHEKPTQITAVMASQVKPCRPKMAHLNQKTPRDRNGDFEPELIKKKQHRFTSMSDKILFLYAQGMTTELYLYLQNSK